MKISFIGFGKAGSSLAFYFKNKGHKILYIYDINKEDIMEKVQRVEGIFTKDFSHITNDSDIIILALPDSLIEEFWLNFKIHVKDNIVFHLSGVKEGIYEDKNLYALHPAAPMTGQSNLEGVVFGLENNGERIDDIKNFIESCGNKVILIDKGTKSRYHLANVIVSNLALSLFQRGLENLVKCGIKEEDGISLLLPLAKMNLDNIGNKGIKDSITGPVQRKDFSTIKKHLEIMDMEDLNLYKDLSKNLQKILGESINNIFL